MDGPLAHPNEGGVESYQILDTLLPDGSGVNGELERSALAAVVTRILVSKGWRTDDAGRVVQGLGVKELWTLLREPPLRAAAPESGRTVGS